MKASGTQASGTQANGAQATSTGSTTTARAATPTARAPTELLELQRVIGNRAVRRLLDGSSSPSPSEAGSGERSRAVAAPDLATKDAAEVPDPAPVPALLVDGAPGPIPSPRRLAHVRSQHPLPDSDVLQCLAAPDPPDPRVGPAYGDIVALARLGTSGPAQPLPHAERIQRSFGRHDISGIAAHTGPAAESGARSMGAAAFAMGDHVAFAGEASLRTAAHEAAHVVQQRAGLQLPGGVGQVGDRHERHADEVAARVEAGQSSEALLDRYAGHGAGRQDASIVQHHGEQVQCDADEAALKAVRSEVLEGHGKDVGLPGELGGQWNQLKRKLVERNKEIRDLLANIVTHGSAAEATLQSMLLRWDATVKAIEQPVGLQATHSLVQDATTRVAADLNDASGLKVSRHQKGPLLKVLKELKADVPKVERVATQFDEELVEFHRFDPAFLDPDVKKALGHAGVSPAELKAMLAQETGDFTDTSIAGLETKSKGVHRPIPKNKRSSVIGIAQLKPSNVDDATMPDVRVKAKQLGIVFPAQGKDPKRDPGLIKPATAIKSAAIYVAYIVDELKVGLPKPQPATAEFKLLVFAAYNGGPFALIRMAKELAAKDPGRPYSWDAIAKNDDIKYVHKGEMVSYVNQVLWRL